MNIYSVTHSLNLNHKIFFVSFFVKDILSFHFTFKNSNILDISRFQHLLSVEGQITQESDNVVATNSV